MLGYYRRLSRGGAAVRRALVLLAVVVGLGGCAITGPTSDALVAEAPIPVPPRPPRPPPRTNRALPAEPAEPDPAGPDSNNADEGPEQEPQAAIMPQQPVTLPGTDTKPPSDSRSLATLAGLNETQVVDRFGRPDHIAAAGQGVRWTWQAEGCEMTVTLFPDVAAQKRRVFATELTGPSRSDLGEDGCLDRLEHRRRAGI